MANSGGALAEVAAGIGAALAEVVTGGAALAEVAAGGDALTEVVTGDAALVLRAVPIVRLRWKIRKTLVEKIRIRSGGLQPTVSTSLYNLMKCWVERKKKGHRLRQILDFGICQRCSTLPLYIISRRH